MTAAVEFATFAPVIAFKLVDAAGGGVAVVRDDGTIASASSGFARLCGQPDPLVGVTLRSVLPELPSFDDLPAVIDAHTPTFTHVESGRLFPLAAAAVVDGGVRYLVLADRRAHATRAELRQGPRESRPRDELPRPPRVHTFAVIHDRLGRALALSRSEGHSLAVLKIVVTSAADVDLDGLVLGCVRGIDDVARGMAG